MFFTIKTYENIQIYHCGTQWFSVAFEWVYTPLKAPCVCNLQGYYTEHTQQSVYYTAELFSSYQTNIHIKNLLYVCSYWVFRFRWMLLGIWLLCLHRRRFYPIQCRDMFTIYFLMDCCTGAYTRGIYIVYTESPLSPRDLFSCNLCKYI